MLQARHATPEAVAALRATWDARGAVRVEHALREVVVAHALETLKTQAHQPIVHLQPEGGFQLWRLAFRPEEACDHVLCRLGRWVHGDGRAWATAITGLPLRSPDRALVSDVHAKGAFVETYDESGGGRAVVLQLGITPAPWPAELGGHPERLHPDGTLRDRLAPGWNTLDLYDVRTTALRRVPLLERHFSGYTVTAWYCL